MSAQRVVAALLAGIVVSSEGVASAQEHGAGLQARLERQFEVYAGDDWSKKQAAVQEVAALGAPVVPVLAGWLEARDPRWEGAIACLGALGDPDARPALDAVRSLLQGPLPQPSGWPERADWSLHLVSRLGSWSWAAAELAPSFVAIALDDARSGDARARALSTLSRWSNQLEAELLTRELRPALPALIDAPQTPDEVQLGALRMLVAMDDLDEVRARLHSVDDDVRWETHRAIQAAGDVPQQTYFRRLLDEDPADPNAGLYLWMVQGIESSGVPDPWVRGLKQRLRERLATAPDARTAMALASLVQFEIRGSGRSAAWATAGHPDVGHSVPRPRSDPAENYSTLAAALEIAFQHSERHDPTWWEAGTALAKIELLQGDWRGMNRALRRLGERPIDLALRPRLAAPPKDWRDLAAQWTEASPAVLDGDCGLMLRFEKDGRGLPGVQVLLKPRPASNVFTSGIAVDTLLFEPEPMPGHFDGSFGYRASDRANTRYAVSDERGQVKLSGLPETRMVMEVLVPAGLIEGGGGPFELWTSGPSPAPVHHGGEGSQIGFRLEEHTVVSCTPVEIRSPRRFDLQAGATIDPTDFVLGWELPPNEAAVRSVLSCQRRRPNSLSWDHRDPPAQESIEVQGSEWPWHEEAPASLALIPGESYRVELWSYDAAGEPVDHVGATDFQVAWAHRPGMPEGEAEPRAPWSDGARPWMFGSPQDDLDDARDRLRRWLADHPRAFRREQGELILGWYEWRAGDQDAATKLLQQVAEVAGPAQVGVVAARLLEALREGASPPERLDL